MTIRIVTWNVNGIRNPFKYAPWNDKRTLQSMLDILEGDIVCFQEVKTPKANLTDDLVVVDGWDTFYSFPHSQTGYSGVAVYTRDATCIPLRVEEGVTGVLKIPGTQTRYVDAAPAKQIGGYPTDRQLRRAAVGRDVIDSEGRCLLVEFPLFVLINVYCPARRNQERTGYRNTFLVALDARIRNLAAAGKNVVLLGDLNITRDQRDTAGIWDHQGRKSASDALEFDLGYMPLRAPMLLNQLLFHSRLCNDLGRPFVDDERKRRPPVLCDTGRELHPTRLGMFTCWDTRKNHRPANYGSRIDYIACSPKIMQLVRDADIQPQLHGSDHCPVYVVLHDSLDDPDAAAHTAHILDYLNPPGRYVNGRHALSPEQDAALLKRFPQSGRRMPHFSNRRHIGNMFRQAAQPQPAQLAVSFAPLQADADGSVPVALPAVLKADIVELVESDDDGDVSNIEDDDSDVPPNMVDDDDDEPEPAADSKLARKSVQARKISSVWSSQTPTPAAVSADLPNTQAAERAATPAPAVDEQRACARSEQDSNAPATDRPRTPPKQKPLAPTKRLLVRARSGTSTSGTLPTAAASSASSSLSRPAKKAKTGTGAGIQTSMSMFLKARAPSSTRDREDDLAQDRRGADAQTPEVVPNVEDSPDKNTPQRTRVAPGTSPTQNPPTSQDARSATPAQTEPGDAWMTPEEADAAFASLDAARASWSRLGLGQRQAPLCEHGEPCKTLVTKKAGVNSGRSFFACARPPGPLGKSEKGTAWQCPTFVWCRDWKPER